MTQLLKFRKRSKVPAVKRNEVVLFADQDGVIKKRNDDGTVSEVGSSGGEASAAIYVGNNVSVPNSGVPAYLTWDTLTSGDELLDVSDLSRPTVVEAGLYSLTINTFPQTAMTDDKSYRIVLTVNGGQPDAVTLSQTVAAEDAADFDSYGSVSITYPLAAGSTMSVQVQQADAGAINFNLVAYVTKLSGAAEVGGASPPPITRAIYGLAAAEAADGEDTFLTWSFQQGDQLLDLSDTENPLPVDAGVYAVTFRVTPFAAVSATALFRVFGDIDDSNISPIFTNYGPMRGFASVGASCTFYCPSDSAIRAWVNHDDTGESPQVGGQAFVQRVS